MTKYESKVTRHVNGGNTVLIEVKPNYNGKNLVPDSISMYAIDQNGKVIVDTIVQNGRRQKTKDKMLPIVLIEDLSCLTKHLT